MLNIPVFKNKVVRDLAWACLGSNLIDDFSYLGVGQSITSSQLILTDERSHWLLLLDQNPAPLVRHLEQIKSPRLGIYFEALWQFFMQHDEDLQLIAHNLPIYQKGKTFGEFDLIYLDKTTGEYTHLELAIKYYLDAMKPMAIYQNQHFQALSQWLGPNQIDRLDKKVHRLLTHQIQLSNHDEGKAELAKLGVEKVRKQVAIKGTLFYPENVSNQLLTDTPTTPPLLSSAHSRSNWVRHSDFHHISNNHPTWYPLHKSQWISPIFLEQNNKDPLTFNNSEILQYLNTHFSKTQQCIMICGMNAGVNNNGENGLIETQRLFITTDSWPEKTSNDEETCN